MLLLFVQGYESALYGSYIQDLKDDIQQDQMHVLFSKANQCTQRKVCFIAREGGGVSVSFTDLQRRLCSGELHGTLKWLPSPLKIVDTGRIISVEKSHYKTITIYNVWFFMCC